jgi:hypothetical protein
LGYWTLPFVPLLELGAASPFLVLPLVAFVLLVLAASPSHAGSPMPLASGFRVEHLLSMHPRARLPREEVFVYDRTSLNVIERRA